MTLGELRGFNSVEHDEYDEDRSSIHHFRVREGYPGRLEVLQIDGLIPLRRVRWNIPYAHNFTQYLSMDIQISNSLLIQGQPIASCRVEIKESMEITISGSLQADLDAAKETFSQIPDFQNMTVVLKMVDTDGKSCGGA